MFGGLENELVEGDFFEKRSLSEDVFDINSFLLLWLLLEEIDFLGHLQPVLLHRVDVLFLRKNHVVIDVLVETHADSVEFPSDFCIHFLVHFLLLVVLFDGDEDVLVLGIYLLVEVSHLGKLAVDQSGENSGDLLAELALLEVLQEGEVGLVLVLALALLEEYFVEDDQQLHLEEELLDVENVQRVLFEEAEVQLFLLPLHLIHQVVEHLHLHRVYLLLSEFLEVLLQKHIEEGLCHGERLKVQQLDIEVSLLQV